MLWQNEFMRRLVVMGVLSSALAASLVLASAATPAFACGCGAIVMPPDTRASTADERVILSWDGSQESMELSFDVSSASLAAGLIIPTPTPATVEAGDARTFDLIENLVTPEERYETDIWGLGYLMPEAEPAPVTVLDRVKLGELEATSLASTDSAGLAAWLATNEFEISDKLTDALSSYVELGWSFTAVRLTASAPLSGRLDPVRLTFATDRLVYPMRLAQLDPGQRDVRVYVFDSQRAALTQANAPTRELDAEVSVLWAGEASDTRLSALGSYLTVIDVHYEQPDEQATSDIGVVQSSNQSRIKPEVVRYRMVTLLGFPVGTLVVLWVTLGFGLAAGHLIGRRRAR